MFIEGILSIFQVTFLPGFLLLKLFNLKNNFLEKIIFSFGLSLIVNYLGVFALTSLGIYIRSVIITIFFLEIFLFFYLVSVFKYLNKSLFLEFENTIKTLKNSLKNIVQTNKNNIFGRYLFFINWVAIFCSILCIGWVIFFIFKNISSICIFRGTDDVFSWNRWALDWFSNKLPHNTWHYPQLIPANWSISYLFMNAPLQYIPKIIMPLFMFYMLLLMFYLGIYKKSIGYFIGVVATTLFIYNALETSFISGFVEIPVAFMSFLSVACLLLAQDIQNKNDVKKYIFLGIIFVAGSAVIKQAGLFVVLVYPALIYLLVIKKKQLQFYRKDIYQLLFVYITSIFIIILPFYLYKEIQIYLGFDHSEINYITSVIYAGKSLLGRFMDSTKMFLNNNVFYLKIWFLQSNYYLLFSLQILLGFIYGFVLLFSLKSKSFRYIFLLLLLPYSLIWAFFFCYDLRNYSIAYPLYGLGLGIGFEQIIFLEKGFFFVLLKKLIRFLKKLPIVVYLFLFIIFLTFINIRYTTTHFLNRQDILNLDWYDSFINKALLKYHEKFFIKKSVLLNYPIKCINLLKNISCKHCCFGKTSGNLLEEKEVFYQFNKKIKDPDVGYILMPKSACNMICNDVDEKIKTGRFEEIFKDRRFCFIKINK
ncbi:hypothetical protein KAT08_02050 [Candidatus Babeliales bacterium]|nr:hypothetical protein [Candidatus Babeliales bacterium]